MEPSHTHTKESRAANVLSTQRNVPSAPKRDGSVGVVVACLLQVPLRIKLVLSTPLKIEIEAATEVL